ncbi:Ig-like domain-containing protein [Flammeovirga yaeyamensis]|uniref:Ig-like domain-containing protein n=1 Tax=Flammeovirga yaeyamensis TaxID=367791 RepID=A0AAX1N404_9BACT|nr:Ig-like domain-containing protein [Flammeovirga yaeyamensis]MBB3699659.1 uncharacterized protein YjdB [Flammeovirga yaeyamensis]NMF36770.1 carbohydrate-binding protein [Flammeovirga yaeyamensis]QWG02190.1 Ig-like domain-containing protein [Flammeovirga yaeyamensis]
MKKLRLFVMAAICCVAFSAHAQYDWDGVPIPAELPEGMVWELDPVSDGFNYQSNSSNRGEEFDSRWNELYINGFSGPSATSYHKDHFWTSDGNLVIHAAKDNQNIIYTGCISSKAAFSYPMFMEARVKQPSCMLAANIWMISQDETEELDMLESYPNVQEDGGWLDQRIHLSHHTFIRDPFQDYQPRDEHGVKGTWYWEEDRTTWHDDWLRIGVYWVNPHHVEYYINGRWVRTVKSHEHSYLDEKGELQTVYTEFDALDKFGYTEGTGLSKPQHIIINMEQQDWLTELNIWPTNEDLDDANGRNFYLIDWVRLYNVIPETGVVPVEEVSISEQEIILQPGETFDLDHVILPANATKKAVSWTTSNPMIATVNGEGVVRAISKGIVTADVTTQDGGFFARCKVEVVGDAVPNPVQSIDIAETSVTLNVGQDITIDPIFTPADATDQRVLWESENPSVAFVGANGLIAPLKAGTTTVTVISQDGGHSDHIEVTVLEAEIDTVYVTGVSVTPTVGTVTEGDVLSLSAVVAPANATFKSVSWSSSDEGIATVSPNGTVTGVTQGTVSITATTSDGGFTSSATITVEEKVCVPETPTVIITSSETSAKVGECIQLTTQTVGETCDGTTLDQSVNYVSSNTSVATVDTNGSVCFVAEGTATISITSVEGGDAVTVQVTGTSDTVVTPPNHSVIEAEDFVATGGAYGGFEIYSVNGVTATNYNQTGDWAEYVVQFDGEYELEFFVGTAVSGAAIKVYVDDVEVGTYNVPNNGNWDGFESVKATDNITLTGNNKIKLEGAGSNGWEWNMDYFTLTPTTSGGAPDPIYVTGVSLDQTAISLIAGSSATLSETVAPANADDTSVIWYSDNDAIATVSNGVVTAVSAGTTTITVETNDGNYTAVAQVTVAPVTVEDHEIIVEAELFDATGGTTNDAAWGGPGNGVNATANNINWVNSGDWTTYTVNVPADGIYSIEYFISTPSDNAQITLEIDGLTTVTDVPNNGQWDAYTSLDGGAIALTAGTHTLTITASGSHAWQWNLDKVVFTTSSSARFAEVVVPEQPEVTLYPVPASDVLNIVGLPQGDYTVAIFNVSGVPVSTQNVSASSKTAVNVSNLGTGIYFIRVLGNGIDIRKKISVR